MYYGDHFSFWRLKSKIYERECVNYLVWLKRGNPEAGQNEKQSNNQSSKNFKQSEEERERKKKSKL
jgi:hypothetical protein